MQKGPCSSLKCLPALSVSANQQIVPVQVRLSPVPCVDHSPHPSGLDPQRRLRQCCQCLGRVSGTGGPAPWPAGSGGPADCRSAMRGQHASVDGHLGQVTDSAPLGTSVYMPWRLGEQTVGVEAKSMGPRGGRCHQPAGLNHTPPATVGRASLPSKSCINQQTAILLERHPSTRSQGKGVDPWLHSPPLDSWPGTWCLF